MSLRVMVACKRVIDYSVKVIICWYELRLSCLIAWLFSVRCLAHSICELVALNNYSGLLWLNLFTWCSAHFKERLAYRYCTVRNFCWISNSRSGMASISTDIFRAVPIGYCLLCCCNKLHFILYCTRCILLRSAYSTTISLEHCISHLLQCHSIC